MKRILNSTLFSWILLGITTVCITLSGILYKQPILYMLPLYISLVWLHLLSIIPKQRNVRLISNVREITAAIHARKCVSDTFNPGCAMPAFRCFRSFAVSAL